LGPDLTSVGTSRSLESIMNEDRFSVQMMDTGEKILLLDRDKLRSFKKSSVFLMPAYNASGLKDKDLQDILAYLLTIGTK